MENLNLEAPEETERLKCARVQVEGLSVAYLRATLPALDPLQRYEEHLRQCLDPQRATDPQLLRQPFELELKLQARVAHWEHRLSEAGRAMIESAAGVHDAHELETSGLKVHWLVFHTTEELGRNLQGCCALVAADGRTVLSLPGAPNRYAWVERDSLDAALEVLRRALRAEPNMISYAAERLGGDARAHSAYLRQAAQRGYDGYLSAPASLDQTLVDLQLHDRRAWLQARANAQGRSQRALWVSRNLAAHERHLGYLRAALAMIPGVGTLIGLHTVYESALLVSQGWRHEDADAVGLGVLGVLGGLLDILLSTLPVGASLSSLRLAIRSQVQARLGRQALAGYEARVRLRGAVAQQGRDQGTWRWNGGQYIWQDGQAYAVYRRANETTLRLRATATRRYEAPVRRDGERWVIHAETRLRGGAPLTPAERIFATWGPGSRHEPFASASRQQALRQGRQLLGQYQFPEPSQASEFAYAYLVDGAPPAWALQYRVGPGASALLPPITQDWQQVRWTLAADDTVTQTSYANVVQISSHGQGPARTALRWQGEYYPLLPNRSAGSEWFIVPAGPTPGSVRELDHLISQGRGPVRVQVSYALNQAPIIHGGFSQTFGERLVQHFPRLSPTTRQAWAEAVYRAADPDIEGLTQARLWALERLLARPAEPLTHVSTRWLDDLQPRLVPETNPAAFDQVRWPLEVAEHNALRQCLAPDSVPAFRATMAAIIRDRGYELLFDHALPGRYLSFFRWPGESHINVLVQRDVIGVLALQGYNGLPLLSEAWLDMLISRIADMNVASMLRLARYRGHLRTVLGGIAFTGAEATELVWARIAFNPQLQGQVAIMRNWRSALRPLDATDIETQPGSGLYRMEGQSLVSGVRVDGQWLGVFPVAEDSRLLLSRPAGLPEPITFEALERCVRERFAEQPWLVVRQGQAWTVRRHLFLAPFDRMLGRVRPGLTPQSALNLAEAVFMRTQGSDHARLVHLEYVLSSWASNSRAAGELADPLLLLAPQRPVMLEAGGWRLGLPADLPAPAPTVLYLRATETYTQNLVAALRRPRMRHHAANVIDDLFARYGLQLEHRLAGFAQYYQPATGRVYLVAYQVVETGMVEVPLDGASQALSQAWVGQWQQRLNPSHAQRLTEALEQGLVVRLLAALRLDDQAHGGVLAVLRLADF